MRKIGRVSVALVAMAAMAGAVTASVAAAMQPRPPVDEPGWFRAGVQPEQVDALMQAIDAAVDQAARDGLSGEPARESIKNSLQTFIDYGLQSTGRIVTSSEAFGGVVAKMVALPPLSPVQVNIALDAAHRNLVSSNQLKTGGDGDIAVRELLVLLDAETRPSSAGRNPFSGGSERGPGRTNRVRSSCFMRGLPDGCDTPRTPPKSAAKDQPASDEATDEPETDAEPAPSAPPPPRTADRR